MLEVKLFKMFLKLALIVSLLKFTLFWVGVLSRHRIWLKNVILYIVYVKFRIKRYQVHGNKMSLICYLLLVSNLIPIEKLQK